MAIHRFVSVACDVCSTVHRAVTDTTAEARAEASNEGWEVKSNRDATRRDLCPEHSHSVNTEGTGT